MIGGICASQPPLISLNLLGITAGLILGMITPLVSLMILLILAPLRTLIATEAPFQLPLDIGQLLFICFLSFWLIHCAVRRETLVPLKWNPIFGPVTLIIMATGIGIFYAQSISSWLNEWLKWVQILLIASVTQRIGRGSHWRWLIIGLAVSAGANAVIGIYQFFGGSGALHLLINDRFFRAFGTFGQPNPFGGFMGLLAPTIGMAAIGVGLQWYSTRRNKDLLLSALLSICSVLLITGLLVSWSRGAWLAFATAAALVVIALPRRFWHGLVLTSLAVILTLGLWFSGILPASIVARLSSSTAEFFTFDDVRGVDITPDNYAVVERLAHWQAALNMTRANPWIGVGLGNYEAAYNQFRLINWDEPLGHAHNYFLNILAEGGIFGFFAYGAAWIWIVLLTWRTRRHPSLLARLVSVGLLGSWSYLTVHSLFDNLYVNNLFIHIGLMFGILGVLYNQANEYVHLRVA